MPTTLTDEDLLREVMNTVGKAGKLGEHVNCVVSVSMLTEGWDANTVTHILGVRAFGTQLLCEQVVGRGLRRMSYAANERRAVSSPNTPRSTACRFPSSRAAAQPQTPSPVRCPPASAPWKIASPARSPSPACSATATMLPARQLDRHLHGRIQTGALHRRHPHQDRERAHRRRNQHPHPRRSQTPPAQRGRLPAGQADAGKILPTGWRNGPTDPKSTVRRRGEALALPATARHRQALAGRMRHAARTTPSRNCCC